MENSNTYQILFPYISETTIVFIICEINHTIMCHHYVPHIKHHILVHQTARLFDRIDQKSSQHHKAETTRSIESHDRCQLEIVRAPTTVFSPSTLYHVSNDRIRLPVKKKKNRCLVGPLLITRRLITRP